MFPSVSYVKNNFNQVIISVFTLKCWLNLGPVLQAVRRSSPTCPARTCSLLWPRLTWKPSRFLRHATRMWSPKTTGVGGQVSVIWDFFFQIFVFFYGTRVQISDKNLLHRAIKLRINNKYIYIYIHIYIYIYIHTHARTHTHTH